MNRSTKITPKSLSLLEQLFIVKTPATNDDDDNLVSVQFLFGEALPNWLSAGLQNVSIDIIPSAIGGSGEPRAERKAKPNVRVDVIDNEGEKKQK
jgi:hypothetical protein